MPVRVGVPSAKLSDGFLRNMVLNVCCVELWRAVAVGRRQGEVTTSFSQLFGDEHREGSLVLLVHDIVYSAEGL